jgi:hypothetical protein
MKRAILGRAPSTAMITWSFVIALALEMVPGAIGLCQALLLWYWCFGTSFSPEGSVSPWLGSWELLWMSMRAHS